MSQLIALPRRFSPTSHANDNAGIVGFAALTALGAQIQVPIPGTPVPMTLQTLPVILAPCFLGARRGVLSMALYIAVGLLGAPVFADASSGLHVVLGATGGYLLGFFLAQPVIARVLRSTPGAPSWRDRLAAVIIGQIVIFTVGVLWLSVVMHSGLGDALAKGLVPFLPGDVLKSALAVLITLPVGRGSRAGDDPSAA